MPPTKKKKIAPVIEPEISLEPVALEPEVESIPSRRRYLYGLLALVTFAAGMLVGFFLWGYKPAPKPTLYDIDTKGFPSLGPADAPVVIVEFSDFQCPYCYRAYEQIYKPLLAAYPGKIRFVYRNFPLSFHPNALASAEAALCAGDQNAYWEFHNTLFDSYVALYQEDQGRILDQTTYNRFASDLGLDVRTFEQCMTSHKYQQFIVNDAE
jgi:protein-disulfide isomerase